MLKWKKNFGAIRWILSYAQCPLVDFWSIRYKFSKTDQMGKISKVLLCLKHVQSPRRIKFWDFFSFKWIVNTKAIRLTARWSTKSYGNFLERPNLSVWSQELRCFKSFKHILIIKQNTPLFLLIRQIVWSDFSCISFALNF